MTNTATPMGEAATDSLAGPPLQHLPSPPSADKSGTLPSPPAELRPASMGPPRLPGPQQRPTTLDMGGTNTVMDQQAATLETPRAPLGSKHKRSPEPDPRVSMPPAKAAKLDWEAALEQLGGNEMVKDPNEVKEGADRINKSRADLENTHSPVTSLCRSKKGRGLRASTPLWLCCVSR